MNKEELINKYIKYDSSITEEVFNAIIKKLEEACIPNHPSVIRASFTKFKGKGYIFNLNYSNEGYYIGTAINSGDIEIKVSDILGEEIKFEVGKWYSFYWNWGSGYDIVAKVSELGEVVGFDNFINIKQGSHLDQSSNAIRLTEIENIKELTLEEIQQYLPDGHPDKIVKEFVLPEKWYIKTTEENQKVVGAWLMKNDYQPNINDLDKGGYTNWYFKYPRGGDCSGSRKKPSEDYIEITFEQFKRYVLKEPKPLAIYDLVEGEIYYCENTYLTGGKHGYVFLKNGDNGIKHLVIEGLKFLKKGWSFWTDKDTINLRAATPEERHWLLTCINQDKFIEQSELDKYDDEGNLINGFKVGDWVIGKENFFPESAKYVLSIKKGEAKYSDFNDGRINNRCLFKYLRHATLEEIAKVSKPKTKESKEIKLSDLNNPVFNVGDKVRVIADSLREFNDSWTNGNNTGYKKGYVGIITDIGSTSNYEVNAWCYLEDSVGGISCNLLELVEPAKFSESKVNRNVYYEVETQEQYNEILDWLESKGEVLNESARKLQVDITWKYVVFNLGISGSWALYYEKKDLLKAEFQFKGKPETQPIKTGIGLNEQILQYPYQYEYKTIDSLSAWEALMDPPIQNSRAELKQESKVQNFIPEIPKVKNRFKTSPIKKRSLPEIY